MVLFTCLIKDQKIVVLDRVSLILHNCSLEIVDISMDNICWNKSVLRTVR